MAANRSNDVYDIGRAIVPIVNGNVIGTNRGMPWNVPIGQGLVERGRCWCSEGRLDLSRGAKIGDSGSAVGFWGTGGRAVLSGGSGPRGEPQMCAYAIPDMLAVLGLIPILLLGYPMGGKAFAALRGQCFTFF